MCKLLLQCLLSTGIFVIFVSQTLAGEFYVLTGHQFNSSFNISEQGTWPPTTTPVANPGSSLELDDGQTFSMGMDFIFQGNEDQRVGFYYTRQDSHFSGLTGLSDNSLVVSHLHFTGTNFYPQENSRLGGFVTAGVGAAYYETSDISLNNVTRISAQVGAGFTYQISEALDLQMDVRWIPTFFSSDSAIFCNGGCTISIKSSTFDQFQVNAGVRFRY